MTRLLALLAALTLASVAGAAPGKLGAEHSMHPDSIKSRIAPVGGVCVQGVECKPAGLAAVAVGGAAAGPRTGEAVYNAVCTACHGPGIAGAPKTGDKGAWSARIAQGEKTLIDHAVKGIRAMPAKGGCASCLDEEIANAVKYMVAKAK